MSQIIVYTDGACSHNPGPGGWGAYLQIGDKTHELYGGESDTTNNRMELLAVIKVFEFLDEGSDITLYTDSKYVHDGITQWLENWKRRGWRTASKKPVKNEDLWKRLDSLTHKHKISWNWVRGHAGISGNEHADRLARKGIETI